MTNEMISILPLSTSHIHVHVATSHYRIYLSTDSICKVCSTYDQFLSWGRLLTDKLMLQGFLQSRFISAFRNY
jgi:hypothetical protein